MTPIRKTIQEYLVARAAEGKAPRTLEVYGARLRHFAKWSAKSRKGGAQQKYS